MDINILNDRKNNSREARIISDSPVMEELFRLILSPFATFCDRGGDLTVVCVEKDPPRISGACIYVGTSPRELSEMQVLMPRPLDLRAFANEAIALLSRRTATASGGWGADSHRQVAIFEDREITLTQREYQLYTLLLSRVGECVSREEMDSELWNGERSGNCADVYVCYLRKKLEKIAGPGVLISVRGRGYMLKKT
ncbi:MAG: winged helix-turn-helix transcriptional regulator [Ruminococcaceae bacterium]|nr:winged helix-turn-helix transcriptional regulator [Oscillospiraceae bacterium]